LFARHLLVLIFKMPLDDDFDEGEDLLQVLTGVSVERSFIDLDLVVHSLEVQVYKCFRKRDFVQNVLTFGVDSIEPRRQECLHVFPSFELSFEV